jgi:CHASE2 domain-containing sensor protein/signal transduction histidine kinase
MQANRRLRPIFVEWVGTAVAVTVLAALAAGFGWFWRLDQTLYDAALVLRHRPAPQDIAIVAIDQQSLDQVGRWPWRRAIHATLLEQLTAAGVKAVAFDILLAEPDRSDAAGDEALARAIKRNGRTVLPVIMESSPSGQLREVPPSAAFAEAAAAVGHVHIELDQDGIARSLYLREGLAGGKRQYLHLAAALDSLDNGGGKTPDSLPGQRRQTRDYDKGGDAGLWLRDHWVHVAFLGPPGHFRTLPYVEVLKGAIPKEALSGKLVLVGATAAGMMDAYPTPVSGYARSMPGVELSANVLAGLRGAGFISFVPQALQVAIPALLVLVLMSAYLRLSARRGLMLTVLAIAGVFAVTLLLVYFGGWWFAPSAAMFGLLACYPLWSWRRLEAAQRYMDEELAAAAREPELLPYAAPMARRRKGALSDELEARIDEVRRASARVRDMRRFVGDTLDGLPEAAVVVDTELRITLANAQAAALIGKPVLALGGKRASEVLGEVLAQGAPEWNTLIDRAPVTFEAKHTDKRDLFASIVPFSGSDGERRGLLISLVDVTVMKDAERKRDEYMRFLSHDLRSPLVSITAMLDLRELAPETQKEDFFARIRKSVERSLSLAEDFVQLGRAEAIDESRFTAIDLAELMQSAIDEAESQAYTKDIALNLAFAPETALIRGVRDVMFRVFINVLSNAIKYSPANTRIECTIEPEGDRWRCTFADQGYGISAEDLPRLFDRFERLEAAKRRGERGVGLGLAFVKTAVEKHGGRVEVQSELGKGSRFMLFLPVLR